MSWVEPIRPAARPGDVEGPDPIPLLTPVEREQQREEREERRRRRGRPTPAREPDSDDPPRHLDVLA